MIVVAATACAVVFADMLAPLRRSRAVCCWVSSVGLLAALGVLFADLVAGLCHGCALTVYGMLAYDQVGNFLSVLFITGTLAVVLFSARSDETARYRQGEYHALLLGALLGAMLLVSANNLVLFVIALETLSLSSYVLAGFLKRDRKSAEASLKYLIYGAVLSGILLFGLSYLYGLVGTLEIGRIGAELAMMAANGVVSPPVFMFIMLLVVTGLGYKMAIVPSHFWCPDVYQGAPAPITAFLSVISKAAGFGALLRFAVPMYACLGGLGAGEGSVEITAGLPLLFGALAAVTMTFGNLAALRQTDIKRLMAYSSIAHAGYLLMPLTVFQPEGVEAMLFYFLVYLLMNLGVFWIIVLLGNRTGSAELSAFRGMAFKAPLLFAALFIFLIALTGLPPTAGFVGKFMLFKVVVGAGIAHMAAGQMTAAAGAYFALALVGVLNSAVSLFYYMKIARVMAFDQPDDDQGLGEHWLDRAYAVAFAAPVLALLYFPPVLWLIDAAGA